MSHWVRLGLWSLWPGLQKEEPGTSSKQDAVLGIHRSVASDSLAGVIQGSNDLWGDAHGPQTFLATGIPVGRLQLPPAFQTSFPSPTLCRGQTWLLEREFYLE